ncbi:endonuclease/exonuclease/phosphatase family protein [Paraflavisolibacter sp. H34]|uniref:endonuclease/exonuclease/phosphatase family protein n=1 Tax=Huijunlia imazamoxiresistens TaxID=3127457 RepID=UPI00301A4F98
MRFSIGTFNVENLVRANRPIYTEARARYSDGEYRDKVGWIRQQLVKMNADIVGFQEVFEEEALRDCLAESPFAQWHLAVASPTGKTPVNALLSRYPLTGVEVIREIPFAFQFFDEARLAPFLENGAVDIPIRNFSRSLLKAVVRLNEDVSVVVFVVHLKSKRPIYPEGTDMDSVSYPEMAQGAVRSLVRRGIEAAGIRALLSQEIDTDGQRPVVIIGDLNDNDTAVTSQSILGAPPFHKLPPEEKARRWKYVFQNCRDIQARKSLEHYHYTYIHNGHYESLDNIFVSNHFSDQNNDRLGRVIDLRLYNDHIIDKTVSRDRKPFYVSDHGQVVVNMVLQERV